MSIVGICNYSKNYLKFNKKEILKSLNFVYITPMKIMKYRRR